MKFVVITYGTEGDTRPLAALSSALIDAGHEVRLLAGADNLSYAQTLGVPTLALPGQIKSAITSGNDVSKMPLAISRIVNANVDAWLRQAIATGRGCDALIVSGLTAFAGLSAAEALGIPVIGTMLIPITPTTQFASPFLPRPVPRFLNRGSHHLINALMWRAFRKSTNAARANVGLPPRRRLWTGHPMLYGISPSLVPRSVDWPDNAYVCGQWQLPSTAWSPPLSLVDFLAAGEPPLYVGFGSMAGFDNAHLLRIVINAIDGRRTLFYPGWSGIDPAHLPSNFHVVDDTPHDWLFPRTSLVIHHGGSGTTHSATRAGVPSVVVPFAGDQFFWAERLRERGVSRETLRGTSLKTRHLAHAIAFAESEEAKSRAYFLGERMRTENGLATAVALIERLARPGATM